MYRRAEDDVRGHFFKFMGCCVRRETSIDDVCVCVCDEVMRWCVFFQQISYYIYTVIWVVQIVLIVNVFFLVEQ